MKYPLSSLPAMARMPLGRMKIAAGLAYHLWPLFAVLTRLARRTLLRRTRIIAVIGSFGKSSTTRAITKTLGGQPAIDPPGNAWTRVAIEILRTARQTRHLALEVGIDGPGQMAAYSNTIRPNLVVVTSIGSEHNRSFKGLEATRSEKAEMIRPLDSSATVILNGDDPNVLWMRDQTRARVVTFGLGPDCDFVATDVELDWPAGTRFNVRCSDGVIPIRTRLIGRPGVEAALAAVTVAVLERV